MTLHGAWAGLLWANVFFLSLSLGAAVFVAIQNLSSAGWPVAFRRVPEAMTAYLPVGAALTLLLLVGGRGAFPWAAPDAPRFPGASYLGLRLLAARTAVFFACWIYFARRLSASFRRRGDAADPAAARPAVRSSAAFLVVFAVTFSLFTVDWLMALEPGWTSTVYPWFVFSGLFEGGMAAMTLLILGLRRRGAYLELNEHHLHNLGKYLFAFSVFWAYLWFCQYLLIWYANIPEETVHYALRTSPAWSPLFWLNPVVNFAAPFALLLSVRGKKSPAVLAGACWVILAGHALDLYLLVMPPLMGGKSLPEISQIVLFVAAGGAFLTMFKRAWAKAPPMPLRDPYLEESLHFDGT